MNENLAGAELAKAFSERSRPIVTKLVHALNKALSREEAMDAIAEALSKSGKLGWDMAMEANES
jgi:hypothetical protein